MIAKLGLLLLLAVVVAAQPAPNRAGLVIQYADGSVETHCVRFSEPQISGLDLLERSGVPIITQGSAIGSAVCKIGPDGCAFPNESCFCATEGMRAVYWALHIRADERWTYANVGAANVPVTDGVVHGWAWGTGDSSAGAQPPLLDIDAVCGPVAQAETSTLAPPTAAPATVAPEEGAPPTEVPAITTPASEAPPPPASPPVLAFAALIIGFLAVGVFIARRRR